MTNRGIFRSLTRLLAPLAALGVGLVIVGSVIAGLPARAARQDGGFFIFHGDSGAVSGITLGNWGSGKVEEDTKITYSGSRSLKIVTHGLYQGAQLTLAKPANLGPYVANKDAYLQFVIIVAQPLNSQGAGRRPGGLGGGPGKGGPGGLSGVGGPQGGGPPGGVGGGQSGRLGGSRTIARTKEARNMENLRVLLITTDNQPIELMLPLEYATEDNRWEQLSIPVAVIPGIKPDTQIKEIRLFGDEPVTFYLGQIRVVIDGTPISVERVEGKVIPNNESYDFLGSATGGYTPLKYMWDWDASDNIQDEGEGRSISHAYHKSGEYTAALTVADVYGIKAPKTVKFHVTITP